MDAIETVARKALAESGALIRESIGAISSWDVKGPADYVTEVDRQSEAHFIEIIRHHFPDHHIMSEETANDGIQPGVTWVIDPLDGTTNFIHGFPFVAISVGVCLDGKPALGFVFDPIRDELFVARAGAGAFLNDRPIHIREPAVVEDALVATGFPRRTEHLFSAFLGTFGAVYEQVSGIRRAGAAALDLAYVAAGRLDGFWEAGLKTWDVAAGSLLIQEAGGIVSDFWGTEDYLHNGHIVAGAAPVYAFLLEQVGRWFTPPLEGEPESSPDAP